MSGSSSTATSGSPEFDAALDAAQQILEIVGDAISFNTLWQVATDWVEEDGQK